VKIPALTAGVFTHQSFPGGGGMALRKEIILAVDEDPVFCRDLVRALPLSTSLKAVSDPSQALEAVRSRCCSAILIAHTPPERDGIDLARKIREIMGAIPIVLVVPFTAVELIIDALHLGICDYLEKPASTEAIAAMFSRLRVQIERSASNELSIPGTMNKQRKNILAGCTDLFAPGVQNSANGYLTVKMKRITSAIANICHVPSHRQHLQSMEKTPAMETLIPNDWPSVSVPSKVSKFSFNFLGPFQCEIDGKRIEEWPGHKAKILFAYLAYHHKRHIYRDILMDYFWPHSSPDSARNCLNVTLHAIRATLHKIHPQLEGLLFKDECYYFCDEIDIELDTEKFLHFYDIAQHAERRRENSDALGFYEAAAALYKGDFLEEYPYEVWTGLERENFAETYLVILDKMSDFYACDGRPATAISLCDQILLKDNCREEIYRRLMVCYNRIGQRDRAIRVYKRCVEVLKTILDVEPTTATQKLYQQIRGKVE